MNATSSVEAAVRDRLRTYVDPYLGITLEEAKAIHAVRAAADEVAVELTLGFPCADYERELRPALQEHLSPAPAGRSPCAPRSWPTRCRRP